MGVAANHAGGGADRQRVGRHVARHDAAGADHAICADGHSLEHYGAFSEPDEVADLYGCGSQALVKNGRFAGIAPVVVVIADVDG